MVVLPDISPCDAPAEAAITELLDYWVDELPKDSCDRLVAAEFLDTRLCQAARSQGVRDRHLGLLLEKLALLDGSIKLGFSSVDDYAVERLGISRRQAQAFRQLARATTRTPALGKAVDEAVLTPRKARILDRVLRKAGGQKVEQEVEQEVEDWIARAAGESVRGLENLVRKAVAESESESESKPETGEAPRRRRTLELSRAAEARWQQARELHGRLDGRDPRADETLEAVAAEYLSGATPAEHHAAAQQASQVKQKRSTAPALWMLDSRIPPQDRPRFEADAEERTNRWEYLTEPARERVETVPEAHCLPDDPFELDRRARRLAKLRRTRDRVFGRDVRLFKQLGLWREAGFISFDHYARERLGLSSNKRSLAQHARLDRQRYALPELDAAYSKGELGFERARLVAEVADEDSCAAWLARAREVTCLQLAAQVKAAKRAAARGEGPWAPWPPSRDASAEGPEPETQLCASGHDTVPVQISAKEEVSVPVQISATEEVWAVWGEAVALVRLREGADLSEEECFTRLLDHFLEVWSAAELRLTRSELIYRIAERDGWRCAAPACTCRRNLTVHHIVFRSRGGGDEDTNCVLVCNRHHLEGIHANRLRVTGQAPDKLVWEMGLESGRPLWEVRGQRLLHWSRPPRHPGIPLSF